MQASTKSLVILVVALAALIGIAFATLPRPNVAFGSATPGLRAVIATSSMTTLVAGASTTLFATSSCAARVISASSTDLYLTFSDAKGITPSASFGIHQASSTTVVYDSGQYGCGLVKAWSKSADLIGLAEMQ